MSRGATSRRYLRGDTSALYARMRVIALLLSLRVRAREGTSNEEEEEEEEREDDVSMSMELAVRLSRDPFIAPCICTNKKSLPPLPLYANSVRVARPIARASHPSPCFYLSLLFFPRVRPPSPPSSDARCIRYKIILHAKGE